MIDALEIYRIISGIETKIANIASDDAILANGIMSKNEISVTVVTDSIPDIKEGDFIRVDGIKYKINRTPEFADRSSVNHTTTYLFEAPEYTLIDKILTNKITKSVRVTLTGKLRDWLELLIWNVNKTNDNPLGVDTGWKLGNIPDTEYMTLSFDGIDCRSLLSELASAYGYEYYVHDHTINYVSRIENERNLTFTQGQGGGLYEVEQSNVDSGDITTRVYPVGGTKNMAPGEGDEDGRLMLPEKYLENFSETNRVVEKKIVFDNIHPSFTGFVDNPTGENYREFVCQNIDFNIKELAIGNDARINFLTGDLMGKSFEFKWDDSKKKITLIYQEDELAPIDPETQSRPLIPSATKHLRGGEEFNFTGIRLGESYKQAAILKLREKATDWLAFNSQKRVKFTLDVDYRYMRNKGGLKCGDLITVSIPSRNISRIIRIVSTEKNLKTGKLSCVVSNYLTEKWEDKIEGQISSMQATINGGSGNGNVTIIEKNDERPLTDKNVLSSLRTLLEIAERALSKQHPDSTDYLLKFLAGTEYGEFIDSMIAGKGAGIYPDGRGQFERLEVRGSAVFKEIIYNRLNAQEGDTSYSENGVIESVALESDGTYTLKLRKRWENDFTAFQEGDIVYGIVNNLFSTGEYYASWMRVLSKNVPANSISVLSYPDSEVPGGKNYPPTELTIITRRGNAFNEDRQSYWYLSATTDKCLVWLEGVTKPVLEQNNYYMILGRLPNLDLFDNLPINYKHSYIFARAGIFGELYRVDWQGLPVQELVDRGFWSAEVASSENPYTNTQERADTVWHYGCKWKCLMTGTADEPQYAAAGWAMLEGNPEFTIEIGSTKGWYFDIETFSTTLYITGKLYNRDVTDHILDADVSWTRDTGNVSEDNAWAVKRAGAGKNLPLTIDDLGPNYTNMRVCTFKAQALLRDGQQFEVAENFVTF